MSRLLAFLRNARGATAAEFALLLPVALLILLGIVDVGRYAWELNQVEKAVQAGSRYAVATRLVAQGLNSWDSYQCNGAPLEKGDRICRDALGTCSSAGGAASCVCTTAPCPSDLAASNEAFTAIVSRMRVFAPRLRAEDVTVRYSGSGIGYAGDPAVDDDDLPLSDIAPVVSVAAVPRGFRFFSLLGAEINRRDLFPTVSASLTLEDGAGTRAN